MNDGDHGASDLLARARRSWSPSTADADRVRGAVATAAALTAASAVPRPSSVPAGWAARLLLAGAIAAAGAGAGYRAGHRAGLRDAQRSSPLISPASPGRAEIEAKLPAVAPAAAEAPPLPTPAAMAPHREIARNARHALESQAPAPTESLALEVGALRNAERALRDGNPGLAQAFLRELDRQVPNGQLTEERDAAATLARCAQGDLPFGVNLAEEFAHRHPASVYRARVEQACAATDSPATGDSASRRSE